jgi:hypothetical protein
MFARTAAFGLLALLVTVPAAGAAAPALECNTYTTAPYHGPVEGINALYARVEQCLVGSEPVEEQQGKDPAASRTLFYTNNGLDLPQVQGPQVQVVPNMPSPAALVTPEAQPLPGQVRPGAVCKAQYACFPTGEPTMVGEESTIAGTGIEVRLEGPGACVQVYPYSLVCTVAYAGWYLVFEN